MTTPHPSGHNGHRPFGAQLAEDDSTATAIVSVHGDLDLATVAELDDQLGAAWDTGQPHICLDLSSATFIDSTGILSILRADARAQQAGRKMTLVEAAPDVHRVFTVLGLHRHLTFVSAD